MKGLRLATKRRDDVAYRLVGVDADPLAAGLYRADRAYTVPYANQEGYVDRLVEIARIEEIDLLVPGHDAELPVIAQSRERIETEAEVSVLISPSETVAIGLDKYRTFEFLSAHGFGTPHTVREPDVDDIVDQCGFPLVVKPRTGSASAGLHIATDRTELQRALATSRDEVIVQEYLIPDEWDEEVSKPDLSRQRDEYSTEVIVSGEGKVVAAVSNWRKMVDGVPTIAKVATFDHVREPCLEVVEHLDALGPINLQARVVDGSPSFFEINTRFSGSTAVRCAAGFNGPDALARELVWNDLATPEEFAFEKLMEIRYKDEVYLDESEYEQLKRDRTVSPTGRTLDYF